MVSKKIQRLGWLFSLVIVCVSGVATSLYADDDAPVPQAEASAAASAAAAAPTDDTGYTTEKRDGKVYKYKKKATYDFEGASIDGVYNKPSGSYISNIKDVKGRSIIRIRENFDAEVIDSSRLVK